MIDPQLFKVEADRSGSHLTLYVEGEIDALAAPDLIDAYGRHNTPTADAVSVDLSAVSFLDSSGLLALHRMHQWTTQGGGSFKLIEPSPSVERILQLTGLDSVIPAYRTQSADA